MTIFLAAGVSMFRSAKYQSGKTTAPFSSSRKLEFQAISDK